MTPEAILYNRLSDVRHMLHIAAHPAFRERYDATKDKTYIDGVIKSCDRVAFDIWMKSDLQLGEMSIRDLRLKAASRHITGYSRLDKANLIKALNANS